MFNDVFVLLHSTNFNIHTPEVSSQLNDLYSSMRNQLLSIQRVVKPTSSRIDDWSALLTTKVTCFKWDIVQIEGENIPQPKYDTLCILVCMVNKTFEKPHFYATLEEAHRYMAQEMQEVLGLRDWDEPEDDCEYDIDDTSAYIDDFRHMDYRWEIYEIPVSNLN